MLHYIVCAKLRTFSDSRGHNLNVFLSFKTKVALLCFTIQMQYDMLKKF
jgi:hypothetical protein